MSAHNPGADGAADHLAYLGGHPEDRVSARDLFAQRYVDVEFPGNLPDEDYTLSAVRTQTRIACKAGWDAGREELLRELDISGEGADTL